MIPAVAKVPRIPSEKIGTAATRKRRQPTAKIRPDFGRARDDADALDLEDREALAELRKDVGGDSGEQQEDHGLGDREALAELDQEQGEQEPTRHDEHDRSEDGELIHEKRA